MLRLAVWSALLASAYASNQSDVWLERARAAIEQQQLAQARMAAAKVLELDPNSAEAEVILGLADTGESKLSAAEKHFLRAVSLQPGNYRCHSYLASTYLAQKRLADARRSFLQVLELNPGNRAAHYNLGVIALLEAKPAAAESNFAAVHSADPSDAPALIGLLEAQLALRRAAAGESARQLGKLTAGDPVAAGQVAALLVSHDEYAMAIPFLLRVRDADPSSFDASYNLTLAYFRSGDLKRAVAALQPMLTSSRKGEAYNLLGAIQEKGGALAEAISSFKEAARLNPTEDFQIDYAAALVQAGDLEPAAAAFTEASTAFPDSLRAKLGLASVHYLDGHYEPAAQILLEAIPKHSKESIAYDLLGRVYESVPSLQSEIRRVFRSYLASKPRDPAAYTHYATMLFLSPEDEAEPRGAARTYLARALALDPGFAPAHFQTGVIAQAEGDLAAAASAYQQVIRTEPSYATAHYRLGVVYQKLGQQEKARAAFAQFDTLKSGQASRERALLMRPLAGSR